ncbi:MAG: ATP-binding protein [Candidatus Muirbacterium halophilum]|nr:ATP-binding protein [Candidatus Muirbacterium halophilum]MCK9474445.1 ATP-binding protein [Candidatus Muirbacterium halophilum]
MIKELKLQNFTVFNDINIDFSPKINIIIGENGTGKSHLLKLAYSLCNSKKKDNQLYFSEEENESIISENLIKYFMPEDNILTKLKNSKNKNKKTMVFADFENNGEVSNIKFEFNKNSKNVKINKNNNFEYYNKISTFIPAKEVISIMKGFSSLYEKYQLSFDKTYYDLCVQLDLPEIRYEKLFEKSKWIIKDIEKICGGSFKFYGSGKVTFVSDNTKDEYSANTIAEGFRKAGILARLLKVGLINPGESGPLFWDEPEANFNPKLIKKIVEILLELARNGQQIIIATHDYILLKWFDVLSDKNKDDHILYHSLQKTEKSEIIVKTTEDYSEINDSAIFETYREIFDSEITKKLENL